MNMEFDESFFESEIRCEYRISEKTKKIWAVELDFLNELLRICKKYNIKIAGYAGTILGTVRHEGFISWSRSR